MDECRTIQNLCQSGQCLNTVGSFTCTCPAGYFFDGVRCTFGIGPQPTSPPIACPDGFVPFGSKCLEIVVNPLVCPTGFFYDGRSCVWDGTPSTICQEGFYFDGRDCIQNPQPKPQPGYCPDNYVLVDQRCTFVPPGPAPTPEGPPHQVNKPCPRDQTRDLTTKECVPDPCGPGRYTDPFTRQCKNDPPCPPGQYYDPFRVACVPDGIITQPPPEEGNCCIIQV